jgi:hypothetical protein
MAGEESGKLGGTAISFLGQPIEHRDSLRAMLGRSEDQVAWVGDVTTFLKSKGRSTLSRFQRLRDQLSGTHDAEYLEHVTGTIDRNQTKLVIAFWGTTPLPDLVALKKQRPKVKIIFMVLCHPLAAEPMGVARQNFFMRRAAHYLDGMIYPSEEMRSYFRDRVLGRRELPSVVIPPCWPASFQSATRASAVADTPNLIYPGRTDFSGWGAQATDDTRPLMKAILDAGIDLHHGSTPESEDGHPHRKPFPVVSLQGLIDKMGGYDASLIAYNTAAAKCDERFRLTVFDRLLTSVTAGVPIAMPKQGYAASKSYLKDHPAVIEFDSPAELRAALSDRPQVQRWRDAAWNARPNYAAERHGPALRAYLEQLL